MSECSVAVPFSTAPDEVGIEVSEPAHDIGGGVAQISEQSGMRVRGEEPEMAPQLVLDFCIVRHDPARIRTFAQQLAQRAALGLRIVTAFVGDESSRCRGNFGTQVTGAGRHGEEGV